MLALSVWVDLQPIEVLTPADGDDRVYNLTMYKEDVRQYTFKLRLTGSGDKWDVAAATSIKLILESIEIDDHATDSREIVLTDVAPAAWVDGTVVVTVDYAGEVLLEKTYNYALEVTIGGQTITAIVGLLEVKDRAVYTP